MITGTKKIKNEKVVSNTWDELVKPKDKIRVEENCAPAGEILGIPVYQGTHLNTNQKIHFTLGEIYR